MCYLELRSSLGYPSTLIDKLRVKTFGCDSPGTTQRAIKEDPNVEKEAAQVSVQEKE